MRVLLQACGLISLLAAEVWILHHALFGEPATADVIALVLAHVVATSGFAELAALRMGDMRRPAAFIIAAAGAFVPVAGLLGATAVLRLFGMPTGQTSDRKCELINVGAQPGAGSTSQASLSVARLRAVLTSQGEPQDRVHALLAAGTLGVRNAISLYKIALRDPVDEVRLLAFSKLEGHRRRIEGRITSLRATLELHSDEVRAAELHHRLADAHDELAYSGLVEGDALRDALARAAEHAQIASQTAGAQRGAVLFTLGRVLLRAGLLDQAERAFEQAHSCGISARRIAPYFAEIAFQSRDFARVRAHVRLAGAMRRNQTRFRNVVAFWR